MTLTRFDLDRIEKIIDQKMNFLPTKEEFFSWMDKVMNELQAIRDEHTIAGHQLTNHEDRIVKLENKVFVNPIVN